MHLSSTHVRAPRHFTRSALLIVTGLVILVIGTLASVKVVWTRMDIEPDTIHTLLVWQGLEEHGLPWLLDWRFTPDNWLLSLAPLHFLAFAIFGPDPAIPVYFGFFIHIASALVAAAITLHVTRLAGEPDAPHLTTRAATPLQAAIITFLLVLNLNFYAHTIGFASYATSHNITNLYGLFAVLCFLKWLQRPRHGLAFVIFAILTMGAVSDPWMMPTFSLPLLLTAFLALTIPRYRSPPAKSLVLIALMALSILAVMTHLFGILHFLPDVHFRLGSLDTMHNNFIHLFKNLGGLLNVIPASRPNALGTGVLSLALIGALVLALTLQAARRHRISPWPHPLLGLATVVALSLGGIAVASVISDVPARDYAGRFFIHVPYFVFILLVLLVRQLWPGLRWHMRTVTGLLATLFLTTSWLSLIPALERDLQYPGDRGASELVTLLQSEALTYGYGPYWGSLGNVVTVLSDATIRLRPARFDPANGMLLLGDRAQTSTRWYTREDVPPTTREVFVLVRADGEECPDLRRCLAGLMQQFGPPTRTITASGDFRDIRRWQTPPGRPQQPPEPSRGDDIIILVWNHDTGPLGALR